MAVAVTVGGTGVWVAGTDVFALVTLGFGVLVAVGAGIVSVAAATTCVTAVGWICSLLLPFSRPGKTKTEKSSVAMTPAATANVRG